LKFVCPRIPKAGPDNSIFRKADESSILHQIGLVPKRVNMHFQRHLQTKTGWLSLLAVVYVFAVLPLIHPLLHHHSEAYCHHVDGDLKTRGISNSQKQTVVSGPHSCCCICELLKQFNIYHTTSDLRHERREALHIVTNSPHLLFIKPFEYGCVFPRPPPLLFA
jgi:hypothetical protein